MSVLQEHQIEVPVHQLIEKAVHLSWNMVTLVPPAIVAQPTNHNEDWHEIRATCWNEALQSTHHLVYFKPVLFYSALGQVGCKGEVGNVTNFMRSDGVLFNFKDSVATRYYNDYYIDDNCLNYSLSNKELTYEMGHLPEADTVNDDTNDNWFVYRRNFTFLELSFL